MLKAGADIAEVRETPDSPPKYAPAVQGALNLFTMLDGPLIV
jgi:hypothetical protein